MFDFMDTQLFGIIVIAFIIICGFIYLSIINVNKEYMKCICGKQPELMMSFPFGKDKPYFGYVCKCGREAPLASTTEKAASWWQFIVTKERIKINGYF